MKKIYYCLLLLIFTPIAIAQSVQETQELVSNCLLNKSTPNERFTIFRLGVHELSNINLETCSNSKANKIKVQNTELPKLLTAIGYRCIEEVKALPDGDARGTGAILMKKIMIEIADNPDV